MWKLWRPNASPKARPLNGAKFPVPTIKFAKALSKRSDTDGTLRRMRQTMEDNRLL